YALIVTGSGHVIRANEIHGWFDAVQVGGDEHTTETSGCDVYRNEIYDCLDDGIETDAARHNVRVFENRVTNAFVGLSAQPVFGGPVYFIRNVVYNWQLKALKFHLWPTGLIVFHNTLVGADPRGWGGGQWRNTILRNNLILGGSEPGHEGDPICLDTIGERADLDYGGLYQARPDRFARLNGEFYETLAEFRADTGLELHARLVGIWDFVAAEEPPLGSWLGQEGFPPPYVPGEEDLRLAPGSDALDAGEPLANVNDEALGDGPDLGAYEQGVPIPVYGPDAELPIGIGDDPANAPSEPDVPRIAPNPFHGRTWIHWRQPDSGLVRVRVYDPAGRLVRSLGEALAVGEGPRSLVWDGRDDGGEPVSTGPYFVRIAGTTGTQTGTVLILR
ncbi:MAG: hypothetical protein GF346_12885, partial [Candidatus Eisenbacteria bacterium]|nr:hypothetical protein [Candidatus Latescibacterota bacterium]MBD3303333.1 hypothetical protein [Candidatus Eisenbacteria bacterium]